MARRLNADRGRQAREHRMTLVWAIPYAAVHGAEGSPAESAETERVTATGDTRVTSDGRTRIIAE
jgi:hypothetical protein